MQVAIRELVRRVNPEPLGARYRARRLFVRLGSSAGGEVVSVSALLLGDRIVEDCI